MNNSQAHRSPPLTSFGTTTQLVNKFAVIVERRDVAWSQKQKFLEEIRQSIHADVISKLHTGNDPIVHVYEKTCIITQALITRYYYVSARVPYGIGRVTAQIFDLELTEAAVFRKCVLASEEFIASTQMSSAIVSSFEYVAENAAPLLSRFVAITTHEMYLDYYIPMISQLKEQISKVVAHAKARIKAHDDKLNS